MEKTAAVNGRGVMSILNGLHNACSPINAKAPAVAPAENAPIVGRADSKIMRYYLVREEMRKKLAAAKREAERQVAQAFYNIANQVFELQVWLIYPELTGKPVAVYSDWSIGPDGFDPRTADMFQPVGMRQFLRRA